MWHTFDNFGTAKAREGPRRTAKDREGRQNLSVYLDRVKRGEAFEVTEHGRPVATIGPTLPEELSVLDRLIAEGRVTPASRSHRDLPPSPVIVCRALSEILREMRDEERW